MPILQQQQDNRVLYLTLNRPEALNALNQALLEALDDAIAQAAGNDKIRCIVITGAGQRAFAAGADIGQLQQMNPLEALTFSRLGSRMMRRIEMLDKPVIAAVNGYALGGGCELALACHLRLAHEQARFGLPEITLGLMPGFGGSQRLPRLIGPTRAMELCLLGRPVDARQAAHMGMVNACLDAEQYWPTVQRWAQQLAGHARHATAALMQALRTGADMPLEEALEMESHRFALCFAHPDAAEGTRAFLEKRKPEFL